MDTGLEDYFKRAAGLLYNTPPVKKTAEFLSLDLTLKRLYWTWIHNRGGTVRPSFSETTVLNDILDTVDSDDVVWDIGAYKGSYTWLIGSLTTAKVVTFEPYPEAWPEIEEKIAETNLDAELYRVALSDSTGQIQFDMEPRAGIGTPAIATGEATSTITIDAMRGDDVVRDGLAQQPTVIKLDVEGAELDVIRGMDDILSDKRLHTLYVEVHLDSGESNSSIQDFGGTPEELHDALESYGFRTKKLQERTRDYHVKAVR